MTDSIHRAVRAETELAMQRLTDALCRVVPDTDPSSLDGDEELIGRIVESWAEIGVTTGDAVFERYVEAVRQQVFPVMTELKMRADLARDPKPGAVDGDVLREILWAGAPERWTDAARAEFADDTLGAMAAAGFVVKRSGEVLAVSEDNSARAPRVWRSSEVIPTDCAQVRTPGGRVWTVGIGENAGMWSTSDLPSMPWQIILEAAEELTEVLPGGEA